MLFLVFLLGLIIGSFLNAVIYRLYVEESFLFERSYCPHCKHELAAEDLIPLFSFLALRGRCRYCSKKISWQYPLIEITTATSFVLLALNFQVPISNFQFWSQLIFISFFIVIAVFDFKHFLILDKVVFPFLGLVIIYNLIVGVDKFTDGLLGALVIAGFFAGQYFISKGRWIGFGDVKFGLVLGSVFGLKIGLVMLVISYFIGAVTGVSLILMNKKSMGSKLPFGVFLSISAIIMLLYGNQITNWYFDLIGL